MYLNNISNLKFHIFKKIDNPSLPVDKTPAKISPVASGVKSPNSFLCFALLLKIFYFSLTSPGTPLHFNLNFPHSSPYPMKKNQCIKKLPKPIKKSSINKTTTVTPKSKSTIVQIKSKRPIEEEKLGETQFQDGSSSISRTLLPSQFLEKCPILTSDFYQIDALDLAPRLLGKYLRRDDVVLQITEVEAYRPNDSACHGRFGITARTAPVFGPGGHAYVYLCYGLHTMLNIVADKEGVGAAVLIRSCAPINGLETIQQRRGISTEKPTLLTGPGKVGQALRISKEWSNHSLFTPGGLELLDGPAPEKILVGPRVGIDYALPEHVNALWRFAIAGTPWISAPKTTLRPP